MQSPCIREASRACFHGCWPTPFLALPEPPQYPTATATSSGAKEAAPRHDFLAAATSSLHPHPQFNNHESIPSLAESFSYFNKAFPNYSLTNLSDQIRAEDYFHLSLSNHVCLDYLGQGLFSYSQQHIHQNSPSPFPFFDILYKSVSLNSQLLYGGEESEFESRLRKRIMKFMNISEDDYSMVFTANKSSAFKLLAESYPFHSNKNLLTVYDHESEAVDSMIKSSLERGTKVRSAEFSWPNLRIHGKKLRKMVVSKRKKKKKGLFVFPLQSSVTGARYSYRLMSMAKENGWHVLLDATSLGAKDMETLGLSLFQPDFLICSFFKIFGENPSGFGCLFVKKSVSSVFNHSRIGPNSGIVSLVPCNSLEIESPKEELFAPSSSVSLQHSDEIQEIEEIERKHKEESSLSGIRERAELECRGLESTKEEFFAPTSSVSPQHSDEIQEIQESKEIDGKHEESSSLSRVSERTELECRGLDHADALGLILISSRARYLINWLIYALMSLKHPHSENGLPLVTIYGPKVRIDRGPTVAFNLFDWKGEKIDHRIVQKLADRNNISLSCGCLQHIWFSDQYGEEREGLLERGTTVGIYVITASAGFLTNFEDVYRLWGFVSRFLDADFVEKERWRYMALNQTIVEV